MADPVLLSSLSFGSASRQHVSDLLVTQHGAVAVLSQRKVSFEAFGRANCVRCTNLSSSYEQHDADVGGFHEQALQ